MKVLKKYQTQNGKIPFDEWFLKLDNTQKAKIMVRLERLKLGLYGNCKTISNDLKELKFDSGLRIYFYEESEVIVILINGGDKRRQANDIDKAKQYLNDYRTQMI